MTIFTIFGAVLIFSVIILVHELGHFFTARIFGVTVHEFAVGMGPALWKKQGKETLYSVRAIPMGGFCQLEGEDDDSEAEGSFRKKGPIPRIIMLAAGAAMNLLLGFAVVLCLTAFTAGEGLVTTTVESVMPESSAAEFLQPGDKIVAVNDTRVHIRRDLSFALSQNGGKEATLTVRRDGELLTHTFVPMETTNGDGSKGYLVGFHVKVAPPTVFGVIHEAFYQTVWMLKLVFVSLGMLLHGEAGISDLSGPVGVVGAMTQVAKTGWLELLYFAAFLAVNIGVMNLLPLPALDGGRILFVFLELIFRKPVPAEKEGWVHFAGLALLLLLMLYATWNDILRLFLR